MHWKSVCVLTTLLISIAVTDATAKTADNGPYVVTAEQFSPFFARCIPDEPTGSRGQTQIVRVRKEGDEVITTYPWYNKNGLTLGWSPTAGKVAVMRIRPDEQIEPEQQIEFSMYMGDKLLKSYTTAELVKLGAIARPVRGLANQDQRTATKRAVFEIQGCQQVAGTNDYYFAVKLNEKRTLLFDITTGVRCWIKKKDRNNGWYRLQTILLKTSGTTPQLDSRDQGNTVQNVRLPAV